MSDEPQRVVIVGMRMSVPQLAAYLVKIAFAAIPAVALLTLVWTALRLLVDAVTFFVSG